MSHSNKPLILVDGSSYLYRAFHAMPPLVNSKNQPTGAVFGVVNMVKRLIETYQPEKIAVVFDAKGKTFRNDMYPEYKANRPPMPDELRTQIEPLHNIITAMGIPLLCIPGVEADDVIGTLAHQATEQQHDVIISTGDKDFAQLVNQHVTLINTMTNKKLDISGVEEKFGIKPSLIIDYLALMGDTVDNVPGVPKVGPKTAVKWLLEYGNLDGVVNNADNIKGKVGENLRNSLETLALSKKLVTIKCDVELDASINELTPGPANNGILQQIYHNLEFKRWFKEASSHANNSAENTDHHHPNSNTHETSPKTEKNFKTIFTLEELNQYIEKIKSTKLIAFDTETTSLDYMEAKLVGMSFALSPHDACYIPMAHDYENAPEQLSIEQVLELIKPILESSDIKKIGQNFKYDQEVLKNYAVNLNGILSDTMLESYVYNSVGSRHNMDSLALKYLNKDTIKFEDIAGKGAKQKLFNEISIEQASPYAAEDAAITFELHQYFSPEINKSGKLNFVLNQIEIPLINTLATMERNGVKIDEAKLKQQSEEIAKRLVELETKAYELAGEEFNLNSPAQLQEILYNKLKLPILKKTPKGQPSTAEPVLTELALDYPLPKLIIENRQLSKLKSTYTDQLPKQINGNTHRVHSSFHQAVTATGRLSSSDPNLQNIPIKTEEGRKIRKAFVASENYKLIAADYSQIELRIMAHLSQDNGLLDAFKNNIDIHKATAAEIFNTPVESVTTDQRRSAKAINFGLIYGMSAFGLAKQLGIERSAARNYIERYFERYPGVARYMQSSRELAHEQGYVETIYGRRLYLPLINAQNKAMQQAAERTAINAPMQGSAADIIKLAMLKLDNWLDQESESEETKNIKMIMQVHDELVFEVPENIAEATAEKIKYFMEQATQLSVPLIVDVGIGNNWDEAH